MFMTARVKRDKKTEVNRSVMCDMRRLGMLFMHFLEECQQQNLVESSSLVSVKDMIRRNYYQALERTATTAEKEEIKLGLKVSLYYMYLLKRLAEVVKSTHLVSGNDDDAAEVNKYVDVLDLNKNYLFRDVVYKIRQNRKTRLRKPEVMTDDDDIELLWSYTVRHCCRTRTSSG